MWSGTLISPSNDHGVAQAQSYFLDLAVDLRLNYVVVDLAMPSVDQRYDRLPPVFVGNSGGLLRST